jgi:hypothetical protein
LYFDIHRPGREIGTIKSEELNSLVTLPSIPEKRIGTYIVIANNFEKLWHIDAILCEVK